MTVVELSTDKERTPEELLTSLSRRAHNDEFDEIIVVTRKGDDDCCTIKIISSGDQRNKELYWSLSAASHFIMFGDD